MIQEMHTDQAKTLLTASSSSGAASACLCLLNSRSAWESFLFLYFVPWARLIEARAAAGEINSEWSVQVLLFVM